MDYTLAEAFDCIDAEWSARLLPAQRRLDAKVLKYYSRWFAHSSRVKLPSESSGAAVLRIIRAVSVVTQKLVAVGTMEPKPRR